MRLKESDAAVDFSSWDFKGNTVKLQDYKGKKTLLMFFRFAACPYCNLRLHDLIANHSDLQSKGLSIIAVFESSVANISRYSGKQNAPFPVIADPEKKLYRPYGLETSMVGLIKAMFQPAKLYRSMVTKGFGPKPHRIDSPIHRLPANFLIDEELIIRKAHYGRDIGDHLSNEEIHEWLDGSRIKAT